MIAKIIYLILALSPSIHNLEMLIARNHLLSSPRFELLFDGLLLPEYPNRHMSVFRYSLYLRKVFKSLFQRLIVVQCRFHSGMHLHVNDIKIKSRIHQLHSCHLGQGSGSGGFWLPYVLPRHTWTGWYNGIVLNDGFQNSHRHDTQHKKVALATI